MGIFSGFLTSIFVTYLAAICCLCDFCATTLLSLDTSDLAATAGIFSTTTTAEDSGMRLKRISAVFSRQKARKLCQ